MPRSQTPKKEIKEDDDASDAHTCLLQCASGKQRNPSVNSERASRPHNHPTLAQGFSKRGSPKGISPKAPTTSEKY